MPAQAPESMPCMATLCKMDRSFQLNDFRSWYHYLLAPTPNHQVLSILPKKRLSVPSFLAHSSAGPRPRPHPSFLPASLGSTSTPSHLQVSARKFSKPEVSSWVPYHPALSPYLRMALWPIQAGVYIPQPWIPGPPGRTLSCLPCQPDAQECHWPMLQLCGHQTRVTLLLLSTAYPKCL